MPELAIKGIYRDRLLDADGGLIFDTGWRSNLIVNSCRVLVSMLMKNETGAVGIQQLQVGKGKPEWDATGGPTPDESITSLVDNDPVAIDLGANLTLKYLNDNDTPSATPTSRIEVVATLGPNLPPPAKGDPYPLREFGLFGKRNNQLFMIDYIRHPLIEKDSTVTLERRVRLIF